MKSIREAELAGTMPEAGQHIIASQKPAEELFDTQNDPFELNNLVNDPASQEKLDEMRKAHAQWSDQTKDTGLIPETIIRKWENDSKISIYDIMRQQAIPIPEIREMALGKKTIEQLELGLKHKNDAVRYWAAIHLGNKANEITDATTVEASLTDSIPVVRAAAARALCKMAQPEKALPVLQRLLRDGNEWNRLQAAQVLDEIGAQARPAISDLQGVMQDENKYVVRVANHALNSMLGTDNEVK
jgi:uncharacterized sulfatase